MTGQDLQTEDHDYGASSAMVEIGSVGSSLKAQIQIQSEIAYRHPRSAARVRDALVEMVTLDEPSAQEAMYALPRAGKPITGPSIRFAEAVKQAWGNCAAAAEISEVNRVEKYVEAVGIFHDLQTNTVTRVPHRRRISTKAGKLFPDDMIQVTSNAAMSVAMREAILKGVPKPVWRAAYDAVLKVIAGDVMTLAENRVKAIKAFAIYGVKPEQVFTSIGVVGEADITLEHITVMRGMFSALKNGEETVESMFAKREKEHDPNYNPLLREKVDAATGEVTTDPISTGGSNEVASTKPIEGTSATDSETSAVNRTAAEQEVGKAGERPATDSNTEAQREARDNEPADSRKGDEPEASDQASATADAGARNADASTSPQQSDLLSATSPADSNGQPKPSGTAEGADASRGETPSAPDRLRSYSKALLSVNDGGLAKLGKQSKAWETKWHGFEGDEEKKRAAIYAVHGDRLTGKFDIDATKAKVEEIIGK